jgi:hypothetical protein
MATVTRTSPMKPEYNDLNAGIGALARASLVAAPGLSRKQLRARGGPPGL